MAYQSPYGRSEGLAERLRKWAKQLGTDKSLPWHGTGLVADLEAAAQVLQPSSMEFDL